MKSDEVIVLEVRADGNDIEYRMSEGLCEALSNYLSFMPSRRSWCLGIGGLTRAPNKPRIADALKALAPYIAEAAQVKGKPRPRDTKNDLRGYPADSIYIDTIL